MGPLIVPTLLSGGFSLASLFAGGAYAGFWYDAFDISTLFQDTSAASPVTASAQTVARINSKPPPTNNATQGTSSARPAYTESGALKYLLFDGVDDHLISTLTPSATENTIAFCGRAAGASQAFIASDIGVGERCYLTLDANGLLAGGYGAQNTATIKGGSDVRGSDIVGLLRGNGSTVELWLNGVRIYSGASSGAPNTATGYRVGAYSTGSTTNSYLSGRIYRALAVQRFIPDADVIPTMRALGQGVVSF